MKLTGWKRTALAVVTAVAALGGEAQALEFGNGDLVLALYGNGTQYLRNLGQVSNLFSGGSSVEFNIAPTDFVQVGGANPVKWALYGFDLNSPTISTYSSSGTSLSAYNTTQLNSVSISTMINAAMFQQGQMIGDGNVGIHLIPTSSSLSFSNVFTPTESLGGSFPVSTEGRLGSLLHLLLGNYDTNELSTIGHAILALDGSRLTINAGVPAAVPIPAAVFLFGSGLIGIVGIARRSMMMQR